MSRKPSHSVIVVALGSALGLACHMVSAPVPEVSLTDSTLPQLLQPTELVQQTSRIIGPEVVRRQGVKVDFELVKTLDPEGDNQIVFNLFPGVTFTGRVEDKAFPLNWIGYPESISLAGSIQGISGSSFQLLYLQGVLAADIRVPGIGEYQIRPTAPGPPGFPAAHEVWKIDNSRFPSCAVFMPQQIFPAPADEALGQSTSSLVDHGSIIDVMIVYTTDARIAVGGELNVILESAIALTNANAAYANSMINTQLRLVFLDEIPYPESGSASTDLGRLTNIGDGFLDEVHTIRDAVGADNVGLFVSSLDACGTSWLMSDVSPVFQSFSFNVCAINCAAVNLTYAHEVGHNLGCQHNRESAGDEQGAFPYSHGYRDPAGGFRTVLSLPNRSPRIMQFSNPLVLVGGIPTGIPEGQVNSADNAKTINNTAFTVANFRLAGCPHPVPDFDCNANCIEDIDDIFDGTSLDCNANSIPDECEVDCNDNGIADTCDLSDGGSFDCNSNSIPDECDVQSGFSMDSNTNNIPDECEDCNNNLIVDELEIAANPALDCNTNGVLDECDLNDGVTLDCNNNLIPDECDISSGVSGDCNANGILDVCELSEGVTLDCNNNLIPDECDISSGFSEDCNANNVLDDCELTELLTVVSSQLSPIGLGFPVSHTFIIPPAALGDVTLQFEAIADLDSTQVSLDVYLNNVFQGRIFRINGTLCPVTPDEDELVVAMTDFNTLVDGGDAVIRIETGDSAEFDACNGTSWVRVSMDYLAPPPDVNNNRIPDVCELALGDSNLDGVINVTDLLNLLAAWGVCGGCAEDTDNDGLINITDLVTLLANWG